MKPNDVTGIKGGRQRVRAEGNGAPEVETLDSDTLLGCKDLLLVDLGEGVVHVTEVPVAKVTKIGWVLVHGLARLGGDRGGGLRISALEGGGTGS